MLWLLGISLTTLLPAIYFTEGHIQETLTYLVGLVVVASVGLYIYFAVREPDRLQSEEYLTEMRKITIMGESGKPIATLDLTVEQTPNAFVENKKEETNDGN